MLLSTVLQLNELSLICKKWKIQISKEWNTNKELSSGYTLREALLEHWGRACVYCGEKNKPLEIEHIKPKAKGGSDRFNNLTLASPCCNQKKSDKTVEEFLKDQPEVLTKITAQLKASLQDAAAVNSTRNAIFEMGEKNGSASIIRRWSINKND
jgi:5-methylcytosine-specific restriction endonuclease McrA